jgi:hypothetical protein
MLTRLFKRSASLKGVEMIFLSKDDCHLCDTALDVVQELQRKHRFDLQVIKIARGDEWHDQYWDKIPVGLAGGRMLFKYRVDPDLLLEKLRRTMRDDTLTRS